MPGVDTAAPRAGGADDLDRMLDEDFDVDALFDDIERDARARAGTNSAPVKQTASKKQAGADLGIDEEVEVKAKRKPVPKLDENLLLSQKGIPRLQSLARERLKFKGKGHEFSDVGRMLNMYQLWLDDLYPRAKFADSLAMVEKAGHGKRMQVSRKEWIDRDKPKDKFAEAEGAAAGPEGSTEEHAADIQMEADDQAADVPPSHSAAIQREGSPGLFLSEDEDQGNRPVAGTKETGEPTEDDLDDLDALLAESEPVPIRPATESRAEPPRDEFADEMEAMADMDMW